MWGMFQSGLKKWHLPKDLRINRRKQDCLAFKFQRHVLKSGKSSFHFPDLKISLFPWNKQYFLLFLLTQLDLDYDSLSFQKQNKIATILHPISPDICWSQKLVA